MKDLGLSTYRTMIKWFCKKGKPGEAHKMFEEMHIRVIKVHNETLGSKKSMDKEHPQEFQGATKDI